MCGGADVEFVAETQEEKDKLQEHMSSAKQHMEDSVVAAYAGKFIQPSIKLHFDEYPEYPSNTSRL